MKKCLFCSVFNIFSANELKKKLKTSSHVLKKKKVGYMCDSNDRGPSNWRATLYRLSYAGCGYRAIVRCEIEVIYHVTLSVTPQDRCYRLLTTLYRPVRHNSCTYI